MRSATEDRFLLIKRQIWPYCVAIIASVITLMLARLPILTEAPFLLFVAPVVICSFYYGFGPGMLCAITSLLLVDYFLLAPLYEINLNWQYIPRLTIFFLLSIMISSLTEKRKQALINEQQARREAEAANKAKDHFLAMTSHELRTPLTAISGWAELLQKEQLSEIEKKHAIEVIRRNTEMQAQLIEDLIDLVRISNSKLHLSMGNINLNKVIESAIDVVRLSLIAKQIRFKTNFSADPIFVLGDPSRLQ